jgi:hypothetical protein
MKTRAQKCKRLRQLIVRPQGVDDAGVHGATSRDHIKAQRIRYDDLSKQIGLKAE